jgi:broad specificity phosphatase PhoE
MTDRLRRTPVNRFLLFLACTLTVLSSPDIVLGATVYLVRHAEKDSGEDPGLSSAGQTRAEYYSSYFQARGVTRVFSTDFRRTRETAAPLLEAINAEVMIYDHHIEDLAVDFCALDESILVVGHSNTTPQLAAHLSGLVVPAMNDSEYDLGYRVICGDGMEGEVESLDLTQPQSAAF